MAVETPGVLHDVRCPTCGWLLLRMVGRGSIVEASCSRCKAIYRIANAGEVVTLVAPARKEHRLRRTA
jgi:phage FluMu protein Com